MKQMLQTLDGYLNPLRKVADLIGAPIADLSIRLYMAWVFFKSGLIKLNTWRNDDFDSTVYLFEEIHPVPGIDPLLVAYGATAAEIILPVLLAIGLFGRFAAAGLLVMTLTIQFVVGGDFYLNEHYYWMLLLAVPFIRGPGLLSVDALLRFVIHKAKKEANGTTKYDKSPGKMQLA